MKTLIKHTVILFILVSSWSNTSFSQNNEHPKEGVEYDIRIFQMDRNTSLKGDISDLNDQSITIINKKTDKNYTIPADNIKRIQISEKGREKNSIITGFLIGAGFGILLGISLGDDEEGFISFTKEQKALSLSTVFGLTGAVIGGMASSAQVKFQIHGKKQNFIKHQEDLIKYKKVFK